MYEPTPRWRHISAQVGNQLVVHSGWTDSQETSQRLSSIVEIFDTYTEEWSEVPTTGEPPVPGTYAAANASLNEYLFTYGGLDADGKILNTMYRLDTKTFHWCKVSPHAPQNDCPMAKQGASMVPYAEDRLVLYGGYGIPHGPAQQGSSFVIDSACTDGRGWTNELHLFHVKKGMFICTSLSKKLVHFLHTTCVSLSQHSAMACYHSQHYRSVELTSRHWRETSSIFTLHPHPN